MASAYDKLRGGVNKVQQKIDIGTQLTNKDSVLGKLQRGDIAGAGQAAKSHAADKAKILQQQMQDRENDQYGKNQDYTKQLHQGDVDYQQSMLGNSNKYQGDLDTLRGEIENSQKDSRNTYSNDIQPRLRGLMEQAEQNSKGAMSLQDAMDPNNKVAQATRDLYSKQGQSQRDLYNQQGQSVQDLYEKQAQGEGKKGLADVGVLSALGMQNMAGQLGGVPMTGGQMQALLGANQAQSGAAYAGTQKRLQSLRDQGIQGNIGLQNEGLGRFADLQNQGLDQGFNRSDMAYNQGQQAIDRYGSSIGNFEGGMDRQNARDTDFRNQRGGISGQTYGLQSQMADINRGVGQADIQRQMANYNTHMGGQQANAAGQIAGLNAQGAQQAAMQTGALQTVGTVAGAYFGGPAGAAAGGQAGKQVGQANAPEQVAPAGIGNYGSTGYSGYNSPYGATSTPSNFVQSGSANSGYGGVSGAYGNAGGAYPGIGGYNPYEDPYSGSSAGASRQLASR